jgi:DedD protein
MADEDKHDEALGDEATLMKKRARRRLIGAAALALFAAVVLPLVMDHQPAPPLKDIQVRIPSPDEGVTQRVSPPSPAVPRKEVQKPAEAIPEAKPEPKAEAKAEVRPAPKPEPRAEPPKPVEKPAEVEATNGKVVGGEAWEVQLGAYQEPGRVKLLVDKLKGLGLPSYTEKVDTPNGPRTRVRAGPFPSQEAAEKAKARIRIIGVDGPVAKKP